MPESKGTTLHSHDEMYDAARHIFDILRTHSHPFILVGAIAHRWMGCAGCVDEGFDMVFRTNQIKEIAVDLVKTGHWEVFDAVMEREKFEGSNYDPLTHGDMVLFALCSEADTVLKNVDLENLGFSYLRLWSEKTYMFSIDASSLVRVPGLFAKNSCLVEEEHHPASQRQDGWWYGPALIPNAESRGPDEVPDENLSTGNPIGLHSFFVPKIPADLDALVAQKTQYLSAKPQLCSIASWQVRNLARYLFLELPHQKDAILFQVEANTEIYLQSFLDHYRRKPFYVLDADGKPMLVSQWDPKTYPGYLTLAWKQSMPVSM
jgi:hypothetical protein